MAVSYFLDLEEMGLAQCAQADPDIFFPIGDKYPYYKEAMSLCGACSVRDRCEQYAIENNLIGIWGGTTGIQRGRSMEKY